MNKKILFFSILFFFLAFAPQVFAQGFTALAPIPGLTDPDTITKLGNLTNFADFFNNLYKYVIGLAAVLAVIMIIWGGLEISTQDSISKQGAGRERITQAIYGLILVLLPVLVFTIINPSILKLSLNLPKLDLKYATYVSTGVSTGSGTKTVDPTTGCTITGTLLQRASCPSANTAQQFVANCNDGYGLLDFVTLPTSQESCQLVSGQRVCTTTKTIPAICKKKLSGTYMVVNLGQTLSITAKLRAIGDNASNFTNFANTCVQEKGVACGSRPFSAITCPSNVNITLTSGQSGKCYPLDSVYCSVASGGCLQGGSVLTLY